MTSTSRPVRTRLTAPVVALLTLVTIGVASATPAAAATVCDVELTALRTDTTTVAITSGKVDKERAGLLKIVSDAQALADEGKTADAVVKLTDYVVKVQQLQSAARISATDAQRLVAEAQAVATCTAS
jgi:hypothetical protein